ncbi:MAG TPA: hypothetical protein VF691_10305, partial [Cytophagaceae bacterium]
DSVFDRYIQAAKTSGIFHLNYGLQGPHNRVQLNQKRRGWSGFLRQVIHKIALRSTDITKLEDLADVPRTLLEENTAPDPRYVHKYSEDVSLAFYRHCVGAFSYYHRDMLDKAGYIDEVFINAWDHVEHTNRIIKKGFHSPFWWFADISDSDLYIENIPNCMEQSTIAKSEQWKENIKRGEQYLIAKNGLTLGSIPDIENKDIVYFLNKASNGIRNLKLLIKFPTRNRPDKFFEVLDKYIFFMDNKIDYAIIVSCDIDDISMNNDEVKTKLKYYSNLTVSFGENKSKIEAINADLDPLPDFDIIMLASDDMIPQIKGFDNLIRDGMLTYFPNLDGVLWFNDGYRGSDLNTLSIMGRKYYRRFNYIYHPSYKSLWCDNEFMVVASGLKRQKYIDQVIVSHEHPDRVGSRYDSLQTKNLQFDDVDRKNFLRRQKGNFGIRKRFLKTSSKPLY